MLKKYHHRTTSIIVLVLMLIASMVMAQNTPETTEEPIVQPQPTVPSAQPTLPSAQPALPAPPEATTDANSDVGATNDTSSQPVAPLANDACPTLVEEGFTAAELICSEVSGGEACIGNGVILATPRGEVEGFAFGQPGDITPLNTLTEIQLQTVGTANNIMAVVALRPDLPVDDGVNNVTANMFLLGDVTLVDAGDGSDTSFPTATVQAGGGLNVRDQPNTSGTIIWQLSANEQIVATGKSSDQQWIRIEIPSFYGGAGWVFSQYMSVEGGLEALPFVAPNAPAPELEPAEFGNMQAFDLLTAPVNPACVDAPPSGLLVQSPNGFAGNMRFQVNDVTLGLNGTAFITAQADGNLVVDVLEGAMTVSSNDNQTELQAGNNATVALNANLEPSGGIISGSSDENRLMLLPLRLLPRGFAMGDTFSNSPAETTGTLADNPDACTLTAPDETRNIRQGPGTNYAIATVLEANNSAIAFAQTRDEFGFIWYETDTGFIRFDTVNVTGLCDDLPAANPVDVPTLEPEFTATPTGNSLNSTLLGDICGRTNVQTSLDVTDDEFAYALGGEWTAGANTTATFSVQGAVQRGEYGDTIRLTYPDGTTLAGSGDSNAITVTFNETITFNTNVSATRGDFVILTVNCTQTNE
jgi:uncharacterized protein YgiM (DUF1202 family)